MSSPDKSSFIGPQDFLKNENPYANPLGYENVSVYEPVSQFDGTARSNSHRGGKLSNLNETLEKGWFLTFKYWVFAVACLDILGIFYEFFSLFGEGASIGPEIILIVLFAWEANLLLTETKAIHYKDREKAEKAVRLITLFMFIMGLAIVVMVPMMVSELDPIQKEEVSIPFVIGLIAFALCVAEVFIYYMFLYGARKVRDHLREIALLQGSMLISNAVI